MFSELGFSPAKLLLPRAGVDLTRWASIACDQYTSDLAYWQRVDAFVGDAPSTVRMVVPEVYLTQGDATARQTQAAACMQHYLQSGVFAPPQEGFVYVRRIGADNTLREGLVGMFDLEQFDYRPHTATPIRPTERTVESRLPARIAVRQQALLECPHILMLCDDPTEQVLSPLRRCRDTLQKLYDFSLFPHGGQIQGYLVNDPALYRGIATALRSLPTPGGMRFAVGDGNHSLCAALVHWQRLRDTLPEAQRATHPARYALAELVNVHDTGLSMHPIHRVAFHCDAQTLTQALCQALHTQVQPRGNVQLCGGDFSAWLALPEPALVTLQPALDELLPRLGAEVDYIHEEETCLALAATGENTAILLQSMDKFSLFPAVAARGVLPRKTFSLGQAEDKRYYLECRQICL